MFTPKENAYKLYHHEIPDYIPKYGEGIINNVPVNGFHERPAGGKGGKDWFGVSWMYNEGDPAPVPETNYLMEDICDWKDIVQFPDLDNFDWETAAVKDRIPTFDRENNLLSQIIHNGLFERLYTLMGFENALCALLTDPDEAKEYFEACADYKCKLIDKLAKYYKPDIICYHDDWGTQRGLFFSPSTWRELIKPATKKIVECAHKHNIIFQLHSDGLIKDLVPEIADDLKVDAIQLMKINNIPELKKITGNKIVYDVFIDVQTYESMDNTGVLTEDILREKIREEISSQAAGGCYLPSFLLLNPKFADIIIDEFDKCRMSIY